MAPPANHMGIRLMMRNFWPFIIPVFAGFYNFYDNGSINSLVTGIIVLSFIITISITKKNLVHTLGIFLTVLSIWGITETVVLKNKHSPIEIIMITTMVSLSLLIFSKKLDYVLNYIRSHTIFQKIFWTIFITYIYIHILREEDIDILEITILVIAALFGILILLPERKN
jgi:hypothetical protein